MCVCVFVVVCVVVCVCVASPHAQITPTISSMCEHVAHRRSSDVCCMCEQVDLHIILIRFSGYFPEFMCEGGLCVVHFYRQFFNIYFKPCVLFIINHQFKCAVRVFYFIKMFNNGGFCVCGLTVLSF